MTPQEFWALPAGAIRTRVSGDMVVGYRFFETTRDGTTVAARPDDRPPLCPVPPTGVGGRSDPGVCGRPIRPAAAPSPVLGLGTIDSA
ncbi:hypothetical protein GCM10009570_13590 [Dietzia natronolimnaea]